MNPDPPIKMEFQAAGRNGGDMTGRNVGAILAGYVYNGTKFVHNLNYSLILAHEVGHYLQLLHRNVAANKYGDGLIYPRSWPQNVPEPDKKTVATNIMDSGTNLDADAPQVDFDIAQVYVAHGMPTDFP
jgi:hypothetical protein